MRRDLPAVRITAKKPNPIEQAIAIIARQPSPGGPQPSAQRRLAATLLGAVTDDPIAALDRRFPIQMPEGTLTGTVPSVGPGKRKGIEAWHGSPHTFTEFADNGKPIFASSNEAVAREYMGRRGLWNSGPSGTSSLRRVSIEMDNPLEIDAMGARYDNLPTPWHNWSPKVFGNLPKNAQNVDAILARAREMGHDGLVLKNVLDGADNVSRRKGTTYAVFDPKRITILDKLLALMTAGSMAGREEER